MSKISAQRLVAIAALSGVSLGCIVSSAALAQQKGYSITVNNDRLIHAQNEPQNWLMMNGDFGSQRYSKLTQINRDNVKNLRLVWALALGGMQDVGQNGPENEVNPLIDNGFLTALRDPEVVAAASRYGDPVELLETFVE